MNNIEYIRNWFLTNNQFLKDEEDKEKKLNILVFYTIVFEKVAGLNNLDQIIINDHILSYQSGTVIKNKEVEKILKTININYAYLDYNQLSKTPGYRSITLEKKDGLITDEEIKANIKELYNKKMNYYKYYNFNKHVYKVNNKVFFSVNPLTENEILQLHDIHDYNQTLYEISHNKDGQMEIY